MTLPAYFNGWIPVRIAEVPPIEYDSKKAASPLFSVGKTVGCFCTLFADNQVPLADRDSFFRFLGRQCLSLIVLDGKSANDVKLNYWDHCEQTGNIRRAKTSIFQSYGKSVADLREKVESGSIRFVFLAASQDNYISLAEAMESYEDFKRFDVASYAALYVSEKLGRVAVADIKRIARNLDGALSVIDHLRCYGVLGTPFELVKRAYRTCQQHGLIAKSSGLKFERQFGSNVFHLAIPVMRLMKVTSLVKYRNLSLATAQFILNTSECIKHADGIEQPRGLLIEERACVAA